MGRPGLLREAAPERGRSAARDQLSFKQSRGVMPFSFAYAAADSSIIGRTTDWSPLIQSVTTFHFVPSHCWNFCGACGVGAGDPQSA